MNPKVNELLALLKQKGIPEEEIKTIQNELLIAAYEAFTKDALQYLSDEDLEHFESIESQEEANEMLKKMYNEKSEKNAEEVMQAILTDAAEEILQKYRTPKESAQEDADKIHKAEEELKVITDQTNANAPDQISPDTNGQTTPHDPTQDTNPANWQ